MSVIQIGSTVYHASFGQCSVLSISEDAGTAIIRRSDINTLEECRLSELTPVTQVLSNEWDSLQKTLLRIQSALITSINTTWGVFSQTTIKLLPHQLWVCNRIMRRWPTRMLVADDVGLGKTMEAGIVLLAALRSGRAKRVLILTPSSLIWQWQARLKDSFNLKFNVFQTTKKNEGTNYWNNNNLVIASLQTVRLGTNGVLASLLNADPWDLVFVDEAHHIGVSRQGQTLGYKVFKEMDENDKIESAVFFTATPHQGINNNFWGLMDLLKPGVFSPDKSEQERDDALHEYMIRNCKTQVVDMDGNLLFHKINQHPYTYSYTPEESNFYHTMTEFITNGYAYAGDQDDQTNKQITLVLIALQKIASSSAAAISHALRNRLKSLENDSLPASYLEIDEKEGIEEDGDEELETNKSFNLMSDEAFYIKKLLVLAGKIKKESRIIKIMDLIATLWHDESILLFTEYKATQALMVKTLQEKYGEDQVGFINGDDLLVFDDGHVQTSDRFYVMKAFNEGRLRFLVSTEASSEGVDLQGHCHVLIHIDLPWNPMRMQQRVGRIYRFGQTHDVDVVTVRNPENIESMIWEKLDLKIKNIMNMLDQVMGEPEDLLQMITGMEDAGFYNSLYSGAMQRKAETVDDWFNQQTQTFGNKPALDTIKAIAGNAARFDLSSLHDVPHVDLADLSPFMLSALSAYGRRNRATDGKLSFITPDEWIGGYDGKHRFAMKDEYDGLVFSRDNTKTEKICAVGCSVFDTALNKARNYNCTHAILPGKQSIVIFRVFERLTTERGISNETFVAYRFLSDDYEFMSDENLFRETERIVSCKDKENAGTIEPLISKDVIETLQKRALHDYMRKGIEFSVPDVELFSYLQGSER